MRKKKLESLISRNFWPDGLLDWKGSGTTFFTNTRLYTWYAGTIGVLSGRLTRVQKLEIGINSRRTRLPCFILLQRLHKTDPLRPGRGTWSFMLRLRRA